jgi:hypothetical protein
MNACAEGCLMQVLSSAPWPDGGIDYYINICGGFLSNNLACFLVL